MAMEKPMPAEGAPAQESAEGAESGGVAQFIVNVDQALTKLAAIMEQAQVPPEAQKAMQTAVSSFQTAVKSLTGVSDEQEPAAPVPAEAGGSAPMQSGGSAKAVPAY